jgi:CRP-like cAMP-binding protein
MLLADSSGEYARLWSHQHGWRLRAAGTTWRADIQPERLREIPLLSNVDLALLERLAGEFVTRHVPSGRVVVAQGEPADSFFLIVRGILDVVHTEADGSQRWLRSLADGDSFGEVGLLARVPRTATVRTRTDCVLLELAGEQFERLLQQAPELAAAIRTLADERASATLARSAPC